MAQRQTTEQFAPGVEEWIGVDHKPAGSKLPQAREGFLDLAFRSRVEDMKLKSQAMRRSLSLPRYGPGIGVGWVSKCGHDGCGRHRFVQQFHPFRPYLDVQIDYAGDIAARPTHAGDKTYLHRIDCCRKDDRNRHAPSLCRHGRGTSTSD